MVRLSLTAGEMLAATSSRVVRVKGIDQVSERLLSSCKVWYDSAFSCEGRSSKIRVAM